MDLNRIEGPLVAVAATVEKLVAFLTRDTKTAAISASVAVLFSWLLVSTVRQYNRLSHIPGPPGAGWSKWWLIGRIKSGRTHLDYYEVCEKYGISLVVV
jgi:hypothetical protein